MAKPGKSPTDSKCFRMKCGAYGLQALFAVLCPLTLHGGYPLTSQPVNGAFGQEVQGVYQHFNLANRFGVQPLVFSLLGEGSAYYLGMAMKKADNLLGALVFLEFSVFGDPDPFNREAYQEVSSILRTMEDWEGLQALSEAKIFFWPEDDKVRWHRAESAWQLGQWDKVLQILEGWEPSELDSDSRKRLEAARAESSFRLGRLGGDNLVLRFVWDTEANPLHTRLARAMEVPELLGRLDALTRAILVFRAELSSGRNPQAYAAIKPYLTQSELYRHVGLWNDLVRVFARTQRYREGESILAPRLSGLYGGLGSRAWAAVGRLRNAAGNFGSARDAFLNAARLAHDRDDAENLRLQAAEAAFALGFREGSDVLAQCGWHRPRIFDRLVQNEVAKAARENRWADVARFYRIFGKRLTQAERQNLEWALLRAHRDRKIDWKALGTAFTPPQLLQTLADTGGFSYPVLMARATLGLPVIVLSPESRWPVGTDEDNRFLWGFVRFGLSEIAFERMNATQGDLDVGLAQAVLSDLVNRRKYRPALRFVSRLSTRQDFVRGRKEWLILYPLAFWDLVQTVSETEDLDPWLFLSLLREESHFDPRIKSHVGATGLSQLMPNTFREHSARMRLKEPDIYDPFTNLKIGGNYFGLRLRQLGHPTKALMAYNAGTGRVRSWNRFFEDQPDELITEKIPFHETRNYVKRILTTRLVYDYLYGPGNALAAIRTLYPNFSP